MAAVRVSIPPACLEVARLYADGARVRQIAELRGTSTNTVHSQIRNARAILRANGHTDVSNAIKLGLALNAEYGPDTRYHGPWIDLETL